MDSIRKALAALFALLTILTALPAQVFFNLDRRAFTPETYQQAFANDDFYSRLPGILAGSFVASTKQILPLNIQGLDAQDWEGFFHELLPPETLKVMGDQAIGSSLAYVNLEASSAVLSLVPLKERMAGEDGTRAVLGLLRTQPVCTLEEIARMTMAALGSQGLSLCNPPEELYPLVMPLIQAQMQVASAAIPQEVVLASAASAGFESGRPDPRERIQTARLFMRLSPVIPLFLFLVMTLLAVRSLRTWLAWWGVPLLATGGLAVLLSILGAPAARLLLFQVMQLTLPEVLPDVLLSNGSSLAAAVVDQLLQPTLIQGLVMAGAGFILAGSAALTSVIEGLRLRH